MAALTGERDTQARRGEVLAYPLAADAVCYQGGLGVLNAGYAVPGSVATGLIAVGRFDETIDNTGNAAGANTILIRQGDFKWANSASADLIERDDIGKDCYIVDDQTVALTNGSSTRSRAGIILDVDSDGGVWVRMGLGV